MDGIELVDRNMKDQQLLGDLLPTQHSDVWWSIIRWRPSWSWWMVEALSKNVANAIRLASL